MIPSSLTDADLAGGLKWEALVSRGGALAISVMCRWRAGL